MREGTKLKKRLELEVVKGVEVVFGAITGQIVASSL